MSLIPQEIQSKLLLLNQNFKNILSVYPASNVQEGFETLDEILQPLEDFETEFGLYTNVDKELLYSFEGANEDLFVSIDELNETVTNLNNDLQKKYEEIKTIIDNGGNANELINSLKEEINNKLSSSIENVTTALNEKINQNKTVLDDKLSILDNKLTNEISSTDKKINDLNSEINDKIEKINDKIGHGNHLMTSSYASFTFESTSAEKEYIIKHNLETYSLIGEPLFLNDDGVWEKNLAGIQIIDENTIKVSLTEPRYMMLTMTAVEYFHSFLFEGTGKEFEIEHNLNSMNLIQNTLVLNKETGYYQNDIAKIYYINENKIKIIFPDEVTIKMSVMSL